MSGFLTGSTKVSATAYHWSGVARRGAAHDERHRV